MEQLESDPVPCPPLAGSAQTSTGLRERLRLPRQYPCGPYLATESREAPGMIPIGMTQDQDVDEVHSPLSEEGQDNRITRVETGRKRRT